MGHIGRIVEFLLDRLGVDFYAPGRDQLFFLAALQVKIALRIQPADIASGDAPRADKGAFILSFGAFDIAQRHR